jgi:hypothetical protein
VNCAAEVLQITNQPPRFWPEPKHIGAFVECIHQLEPSDQANLVHAFKVMAEAHRQETDRARGEADFVSQMLHTMRRAQEVDEEAAKNDRLTLGEAIAILERHGIKPGISQEVLEMEMEVPVMGSRRIGDVLSGFERDQRRVFALYWREQTVSGGDPNDVEVVELIQDVAELDAVQASAVLDYVLADTSEEVRARTLRMADIDATRLIDGKNDDEALAAGLGPSRHRYYHRLCQYPDQFQGEELGPLDMAVFADDADVAEFLAVTDQVESLMRRYNALSQTKRAVTNLRYVMEEGELTFERDLARNIAIFDEVEAMSEQEAAHERARLEEDVRRYARQYVGELKARIEALGNERQEIFDALMDERRGGKPPGADERPREGRGARRGRGAEHLAEGAAHQPGARGALTSVSL